MANVNVIYFQHRKFRKKNQRFNVWIALKSLIQRLKKTRIMTLKSSTIAILRSESCCKGASFDLPAPFGCDRSQSGWHRKTLLSEQQQEVSMAIVQSRCKSSLLASINISTTVSEGWYVQPTLIMIPTVSVMAVKTWCKLCLYKYGFIYFFISYSRCRCRRSKKFNEKQLV